MTGPWGSLMALTGFCEVVVLTGISLAAQSTLLLTVGLLVGCAVRRRGPVWQALVYRATLAGIIVGALCFIGLARRWQPMWRVSLPPATSGPASSSARASSASGDAEGAALAEAIAGASRFAAAFGRHGLDESPAASPGEQASARIRRVDAASPGRGPAAGPRSGQEADRPGAVAWLYLGAVGVWGTGATTLLGWMLLCLLYLQRLRRESAAVPAGELPAALEQLCVTFRLRPPLLLSGRHVRSPFLLGLRRPAILLPADYKREFDESAIRAVLAHELCHLARRDCQWTLLARVTGAVGWMQPLLWVLCRRMEETSEEICDREVIRREVDARSYADCLLCLAERLVPSRAERAIGMGVVPLRSALGRRIRLIMEAGHRPMSPVSARLRAGVSLGAACLIALGLFLVAAAAAPIRPTAPDTLVTDPRLWQQRTGPSARGTERSVFADAAELRKTVSYTETKIALAELIQRVAADTGARLTALPEVADEPVAVVVKEMPAGELLEQLAELLDYQWSRRGQSRSDDRGGEWRYEIHQDLASKQREEALRQAVFAQIEQQFRKELARYMEVGSLNQAQMQTLWDEEKQFQKRLEKLSPQEQQVLASAPQEATRRRRAGLIFPLWSPIARALTRLMGQMTEQQWSTLLQEGRLTFSTDPRRGELRLPVEIARTFRESRPGLNAPDMYSPSDPETEERMRRWEQEGQAEWASGSGYRANIDLDVHQFQAGGSLSLSADAEPIRNEPGIRYGAGFSLGSVLGATVHINAQAAEPLQQLQENQTPERSAALEKDPIVGSENRHRVTSSAQPRPLNGIPEIAWSWWLRDLLPAMAKSYDVQFISDAYWNHAAEASIRTAARESTPLYTLLDGRPTFTHRWDRRGNLIRLRSRTWFLDRPREVPVRMARRWKTLLDERGVLPLEEYLRMVAELDDAKLASLDDIASELGIPNAVRDLFGANHSRKVLRLYASLSAGQRHMLWRGEALPVARMLPAQRELLLSAVKETNRGRSPQLDLGRFASARIVLNPRPFFRVFTKSGTTVAIREEYTPEEGGPNLPAGEVAPGVRRFPATRLWFEYQAGDEKQDVGMVYIERSGAASVTPRTQ
jgi:beta-lactamase regulating signal transducer with metallopeptidase domain